MSIARGAFKYAESLAPPWRACGGTQDRNMYFRPPPLHHFWFGEFLEIRLGETLVLWNTEK